MSMSLLQEVGVPPSILISVHHSSTRGFFVVSPLMQLLGIGGGLVDQS